MTNENNKQGDYRLEVDFGERPVQPNNQITTAC